MPGALALVATLLLIPAAPSTASPQRTVMTIARGDKMPIPRSFFGLSIEYPGLQTYLTGMPIFERLLKALEVPGGGPLVLRIGGDSADRTYWNPGAFPLVLRPHILTPQWFAPVSILARDLALRVVFDLNLRHSTPQLSAGLAQAAITLMPQGSIGGFEIGNEPNRYRKGYSAQRYARDFRAWANALAPIAPSVPLMGPASGNSGAERSVRWLREALISNSQLNVVTAHRYPLSACVRRASSPYYPTVSKLLSDELQAALLAPVRLIVRLAHSSGRPFRLDEFNSVTCGGRRGVSDTFATALWAPDALFHLLRAGVDGVSVHIRPETINGPFVITKRGLVARPLLYGLLLFARTLNGSRWLVRVHQAGPQPAGLTAWAVLDPHNRLHMLLVNRSDTAVSIALRLQATGKAIVERLRASSVSATSGVTLAGRHLNRQGHWRGPLALHRVPSRAGDYDVSLPSFSAAYVDVQLR